MADPYEIAREALELAEKATPGPMWADDTGHLRYASRDGIDDADIATFWTDDEREREDAPFFAHAGTHYAAVCRALLAQRAVVEAAVAQEEAYAKARASDWGTVERDDLLHEAKKCASATGAAVRAYLAAKEQK